MNQNNVTTSKFAQYYHAQHIEYSDDFPFWEDLAKTQNGNILELGCGTGRVLIPLARAGYKIYGVDIDPEMLKITQSQIDPELSTKIQLAQADMRTFQMDESFSLIISPCNTFSTLPKNDRQKTLAKVRQHLEPQGIFGLSIPNPEILNQLETSDQPEIEAVFPHPETKEPVQVSCDWERTPESVTMNWYYDHLLPDGRVDRFTAATRHYIFSISDFLEEIKSGGFFIQNIFGDFDYEPFDRDAPNLIVIAKKI